MHRVDRRLRLFRSRPEARFDADQLAIEAAPRERAARLVRGALHAGRPVILQHQPWAAVPWFLQDVAADLSVGEPPMDARVVDLGTGGGAGDTWTRVPEIIARGLGIGASRAAAPTSAEDFRERTAMALRKGRSVRRRKALLCLEADAIGGEDLQGICDAWSAARAEMTPGTVPMLVLACPIGGPSLALEGALSFFLADPTEEEAVGLAAELLGPEPDHVRELVRVVGPVPSLLLAAGRRGGPCSPGALLEAIGSLHQELERSLEQASTVAPQAARLDALARVGPLPFEQDVDEPLQRTGLVSVRSRRGPRTTHLRTPLLRSLLGIAG